MKIRTTKYIIKEGILNAYRNKLMSLASLSIVIASLIIFGIFFLVSVNLSQNLNGLKEQPEIQVFCFPELDETQLKQIEDSIKDNPKIQEYTVVSKKEAFEKVKKDVLAGKEIVLQGLDESFMPVSFILKLKNPELSQEIVDQYKSFSGVENVTHPKQVIEFITRVTYWVPFISAALLIILLIISIFIIANTIKLTVFARRREISIMKYIGATDWFIRWPFVIEGIIIGIAGAIVALVLVSYGYNALESMLSNDLSQIGISIVKLVKFGDIGWRISGIFLLVGTCVGAMGSLVSLRKYLRV